MNAFGQAAVEPARPVPSSTTTRRTSWTWPCTADTNFSMYQQNLTTTTRRGHPCASSSYGLGEYTSATANRTVDEQPRYHLIPLSLWSERRLLHSVRLWVEPAAVSPPPTGFGSADLGWLSISSQPELFTMVSTPYSYSALIAMAIQNTQDRNWRSVRFISTLQTTFLFIRKAKPAGRTL